jgi:hypothetical protein
MFGVKDFLPLTAASVLKKVDEYSLWKYYCPSFKSLGKTFKSEIREDNNASCSITIQSIGYIYKDFRDGTYNIFSYIQKKYSCNFNEALLIINNDFNLGLANKAIEKPTMGFYGIADLKSEERQNSKLIINVKIRDWNLGDKEYWCDQYCISSALLREYHIFPLKFYTLEMDDKVYRFNCSKNTYGYWFGGNHWKIYQPLDPVNKWYGNLKYSMFNGWNQLPESADRLIITSSMKDVLAWRLLDEWSIAPQTESQLIPESIIHKLISRFPQIYINYDNDFSSTENSGQLFANKIINTYKEYELKNLIIPDKYKSKDISDLIKNHRLEEAKQLRKKLII